MKVKPKISNQPVGGVPGFQISAAVQKVLTDELKIAVTDDDKSELQWIVRNFMADTIRHKEGQSVDDLLAVFEKLRAGSKGLLALLQGGERGRRETIRRMLMVAANKPYPIGDEDGEHVERKPITGQVIDSIQVYLTLLARCSGVAAEELELQTGRKDEEQETNQNRKQPGSYGFAWETFVLDMYRWVEDRGSSTNLPRNISSKDVETPQSTPFLHLFKLLLSELPSGFTIRYSSDQALAQRIRLAGPGRGTIK